ncbi:hypothetical protein ABZ807_32735 [Micromonospora sp. NPDC047548]|uniref:hypothetical protein n=1 Tax=Micromonospora sp. NPDC047548 TaxID=3155624 RepID=UPI0033FBE9D0
MFVLEDSERARGLRTMYVASPYSTGGGGVTFEHDYGGWLLADLLLGRPTAGLGDGFVVQEVWFQQATTSPVDDIVVVGASSAERRILSIGVRRNPVFKQSDPKLLRLVSQYLRMVVEFRQELDSGERRLGLAVSATQSHVADLVDLAGVARTQNNPGRFQEAVSARSTTIRAELQRVSRVVNAATQLGADAAKISPDELTWRFLAALHVIRVDLDGEDSGGKADLVASLTQLTNDATVADHLRLYLNRLAATFAQRAGRVDSAVLRRELYGRFELGLSVAKSRSSPYRALFEDYAARCPELKERDSEFAQLAKFASESQGYLHLRGGAWAGKTALVSHLAVDPPPLVDIVGFFVSRRGGTGRAGQFLQAACLQLAALMDEVAPVEPSRADFLDLWARAAASVRRQQRSMLLIVDGLDEDDARQLNEPSIASQLPHRIEMGANVLVTSRSNTDIPSDVDTHHPLRTCEVWNLHPSPAAAAIRVQAQHELDHVLDEDELRKITAIITVARGGLTIGDLSEILGTSVGRVRGLVKGRLARVLEQRQDRQRSTTHYTIAHDTLVELLRHELTSNELGSSRLGIDRWAQRWQEDGWPANTPEYLVESYPSMLAADRDGRMLALLASESRQALLSWRTGGETAALTEFSDAAALLAQECNPDLQLLTRVSVLRHNIHDRADAVPSEYVLALARIGRLNHAVQLARTIPYPNLRSHALLQIARDLLPDAPGQAAAVAAEAEYIPGRLAFDDLVERVGAAVLQALAGDEAAAARARAAAESLLAEAEEGDEWRLSALSANFARLDHDIARRLLAKALEVTDEPGHLLASSADVLVRLDELHRLFELLEGADPATRLSAGLDACSVLWEEGERCLPENLTSALGQAAAAMAAQLARSSVVDVDSEDLQLLAKAARYIDARIGQIIIDLVALHPRSDRDVIVALAGAYAAHGVDPRQVPDLALDDDVLAESVQIACQVGELNHAPGMASQISDPRLRVDAFAQCALAMLNRDDADGAHHMLNNVAAALAEVRSKAQPVLVAELSAAAHECGQMQVSEYLHLQTSYLLNFRRFEDWDLAWGTRFLASCALRHPPGKWFNFFDGVSPQARFRAILAAARLPAPPSTPARLLDDLESLLEQANSPLHTTELAEFALEVGEPARALAILAQDGLEPGSLAERVVVAKFKALLALGMSKSEALGFYADAAGRDGDLGARLAVALADAGLIAEAATCVRLLLQTADPDATRSDGRWPNAWLTLACLQAGLRQEADILGGGLAGKHLVVVDRDSVSMEDLTAIVRLGLWDTFARDLLDANAAIAMMVMEDLFDEMLKQGLVEQTVALLEQMHHGEGKAAMLAKCAARDDQLVRTRQLVAQSMSLELVPEVILPAIRLSPVILHEMASLLLGRPIPKPTTHADPAR